MSKALSGIFPKSLKNAVVRFLLPLILNNYRAIPNPSFIGNIIEKVALAQLKVFWTDLSLALDHVTALRLH